MPKKLTKAEKQSVIEKQESEAKILEQALKEAKIAEEYWSDSRKKNSAERTFVFAEDQWDDDVRTMRGNLPCLNANDLPIFLDQVVSEHRLNRGAIEVKPVDSDSDPKKAEIRGGLIRNIEHVSDAHVAYDEALEFVTSGGYCGSVRVITEYETDDIFDDDGKIREEFTGKGASKALHQVIRIVSVENQLNVLYDPSAQLWHANDGNFLFYFDDIDVEVFKKEHPGKAVVDFAGDIPEAQNSWINITNNTVRIAEYLHKEKKGSSTVYLVINPKGPASGGTEKDEYTLTKIAPEDKDLIIKTRHVEDFKIVWYKISGLEVLEGPVEIPGRLWPFIPCWGKKTVINGKKDFRGLFRYAPDPQRGYIYTQSKKTELIALQPKNPYIGTTKMFEGHEPQWRTMNTENRPYLKFNADDAMPGMFPKREDPPPISTALIEEADSRQREKRNVIGFQEASLGQRSGVVSGRALEEQKQPGNAVAFTFHDNAARMKKQVGRVVGGMVPIIYPEPRVLAILGIDGKQGVEAVNQDVTDGDGNVTRIDMTVGRYDVIYKSGPSYATQRIEAITKLTDIMQYAPNIGDKIADIIIDLLDIPGGDKIVARLEAALPPEIRAAGLEKGDISQSDVLKMVQQGALRAIEEYKQSQEGMLAEEKTKQALEKTKQEVLQTQQERFKTMTESEGLKETVAEMIKEGSV